MPELVVDVGEADPVAGLIEIGKGECEIGGSDGRN